MGNNLRAITVIGAGISGLTSAMRLREAGYPVRVVAEKFEAGTVSSVAGALWFPYECGPAVRVNRLARETYVWMSAVATMRPEAGIDLIENYETAITSMRPEWQDALPPHASVEWVAKSPVHREHGAWRFAAPRADPRYFLPWCRRQLSAAGVDFECRRAESLAIEADHAMAVVNCTGSAARRLAGDDLLRGLLCHLRIAEIGAWPSSRAAADEIATEAYVIPRRGCMVVGGTRIPTDAIGVRAGDRLIGDRLQSEALSVGIQVGKPIADVAGVLPCRDELRLCHDGCNPRIIHNYGHGGAGWTLSWGCAGEVLKLARQIADPVR